MRNFFHLRQNNSGGRFEKPGVNVFIEADDRATAEALLSPHITLCGDSGMYAEYDSCGCCPCCGHRWSFYGEKPETPKDLAAYLDPKWSCGPDALIKADGTLYVGETKRKAATLRKYVLQP